jgi:hypothetical protein
MQPQQMVAQAAQGPSFYELVLGGIGLIIALILGEMVRRLYSNHYKGHAGQLERLETKVDGMKEQLDKCTDENRESHQEFYNRIGALEVANAGFDARLGSYISDTECLKRIKGLHSNKGGA